MPESVYFFKKLLRVSLIFYFIVNAFWLAYVRRLKGRAGGGRGVGWGGCYRLKRKLISVSENLAAYKNTSR